MIENLLNKKKYIGQSKHIEQRWKEHICCSKKETTNHLHSAIRKYGVENFQFSIIEECSIEELNKRESYWINYYHTFENGYNHTTGGNQNVQFSSSHKKNLSIARRNNKDKISQITKELWKDNSYREKVIENREAVQQNAKPVIVFKDNQPIKQFPSIWQCSSWLFQNGYGNSLEANRSNVRKHLRRNSKTYMKTNIQIRYL